LMCTDTSLRPERWFDFSIKCLHPSAREASGRVAVLIIVRGYAEGATKIRLA
jgi:hypothetical protein